jgi:hypothetical protein
MTFSRSWETCDSNDIVINQDATYLIWSYGETDDITYHGGDNRGSLSIYLLDPPNPEVDKTGLLSWPIQITYLLPTNDTVYYCSIHKAPQLNIKHHIVGVSPCRPALVPSVNAIFNFYALIIKECVELKPLNACPNLYSLKRE